MSEFEIDITQEQHYNIMRKCVDLAGVKYGTLELIGMGFEKLTGIKSPFRDGRKTFVCSELVMYILNECGIVKLHLDSELAGPKELECALKEYSSECQAGSFVGMPAIKQL